MCAAAQSTGLIQFQVYDWPGYHVSEIANMDVSWRGSVKICMDKIVMAIGTDKE